MRALLIGDIHTEAELLAKALAFGAREGVDVTISVGDIVDGPGDPLACIAQLVAANALVIRGNHERWVAEGHPFSLRQRPSAAPPASRSAPASRGGARDPLGDLPKGFEPFDYPPDALAWIAALPATRELATPSGRVLVGHGVAGHDMARLDPDTRGYELENLEPLLLVLASGRFRWLIGGHTHVPMVRTFDGDPPLTVLNPGTLVSNQEPGCMLADFATGAIVHHALPDLRVRARYAVPV